MSATRIAPAASVRAAPHALREYALLADGERGAILGPRGDVAWLCFPRWDAEPVFSSLIGGGGAYVVTPAARFVWGGFYEEGTLIWRSRWITEDNGIVECREALAYPGDPRRAVLLRRIEAVRGGVPVAVELDLRAGFGQEGVRGLARDDGGVWRGRVGAVRFAWAGGDAARAGRPRAGALRLDLRLEEGQRHDLVLVLGPDREDVPDPDAAWVATEAAWHRAMPAFEATIATRDARHAYAVLAGLTSAGGGTVAAATMSLPERTRRGRNYDYRYVWIRDQAYVGTAVARSAPSPLLDIAVGFVRDRLLADGAALHPAYTVTGERVPDERRLDLAGYPGGRSVVGNHANAQFQLDAFGEALLLLADGARHDRLDADGWRAATVAVDAIAERWREPDAGIWELEPDAWTHSRLTCAAGLRAIAAVASHDRGVPRWLALADTIIADTARHALHPSGRWQRSPDDARVDAALLLPAIRGAISADDPRTVATLDAVASELTDDGYAYRYRHGTRPLGEDEGAFLLCGFMLALAYAQQGDAVAAARWFERNRAACGPPGLLAEEYDVRQRQLRGNLPQAFVHALLLEAAAALRPILETS